MIRSYRFDSRYCRAQIKFIRVSLRRVQARVRNVFYQASFTSVSARNYAIVTRSCRHAARYACNRLLIAIARPRCHGLPCILRELIQLYRLSTTTTNTPNEIRASNSCRKNAKCPVGLIDNAYIHVRVRCAAPQLSFPRTQRINNSCKNPLKHN